MYVRVKKGGGHLGYPEFRIPSALNASSNNLILDLELVRET